MLDFAPIDDPHKLVKFEADQRREIPSESICARREITVAEQAALQSLAGVIDLDNYRDIFSIVIKKHYRKNGGDNFVWNTLLGIAAGSNNTEVVSKIHELYRYFLIERQAEVATT
jgi:hypothetical protein